MEVSSLVDTLRKCNTVINIGNFMSILYDFQLLKSIDVFVLHFITKALKL